MPAAPSTRTLILLAAERLFAERGIAAVSLREIAAAAGQGNTSAAAYHFGTKADLFTAIVEYRTEPINRHRLELVDAIDRGNAPDDLRTWVEALVVPMAAPLAAPHEPLEREPGQVGWYLEFLVEAMRYRRISRGELGELRHVEGVVRTLDGLRRHLSPLPARVVDNRLDLTLEFVPQALAHHERLLRESHVRPRPADTQLAIGDLIDAMVGLLSAPCSPAVRAAADETVSARPTVS